MTLQVYPPDLPTVPWTIPFRAMAQTSPLGSDVTDSKAPAKGATRTATQRRPLKCCTSALTLLNTQTFAGPRTTAPATDVSPVQRFITSHLCPFQRSAKPLRTPAPKAQTLFHLLALSCWTPPDSLAGSFDLLHPRPFQCSIRGLPGDEPSDPPTQAFFRPIAVTGPRLPTRTRPAVSTRQLGAARCTAA